MELELVIFYFLVALFMIVIIHFVLSTLQALLLFPHEWRKAKAEAERAEILTTRIKYNQD